MAIVKSMFTDQGLSESEWAQIFCIIVALLNGEIKRSLKLMSGLFANLTDYTDDFKKDCNKFIVMIEGSIDKDISKILEGFSLMSELFSLPNEITVIINLTSVLLQSGIKEELDTNSFESALKDFGNTFKVESSIISAVIAIAKHDIDSIAQFAERFGRFEPGSITKIVHVIENIQSPKSSDSSDSQPSSEKSTQVNGSNDHKVDLSSLDPGKVFDMFDKDHSGFIDYNEFTDLIKYMNVNVTPPRALKIFSEAASADGRCDKVAFEKALAALNELVTEKVLADMGLSVGKLVAIFVALVLLLLGLFAFIFLGIAAFKTGNTFGTVINSILPCAAAAGLSTKKGVDKDETESKSGQVVKKTLENIQKKT